MHRTSIISLSVLACLHELIAKVRRDINVSNMISQARYYHRQLQGLCIEWCLVMLELPLWVKFGDLKCHTSKVGWRFSFPDPFADFQVHSLMASCASQSHVRAKIFMIHLYPWPPSDKITASRNNTWLFHVCSRESNSGSHCCEASTLSAPYHIFLTP